MTRVIEPPNSVVLLVGREDFTPPQTFGDSLVAATHDCLAIGVLSVDDGPTTISITQTPDESGSARVAEFVIETEGTISVRDVYNREYEAIGVGPGTCLVTAWANDSSEPDVVTFEIKPRH